MNSSSSFLILGREQGLAFAEIYQCLGGDKIDETGREAVIVRDDSLGKQAAELLGGVPKSGVILQRADKLSPDLLADILRPYIVAGKKFHFGLSDYVLVNRIPSPFKGEGRVRVGLSIKKILKQAGYSVRLVESKSGNLSSVDVVKNKLLSSGAELCIFVVAGGYLIGKTEAVQPFADYSRRDYGRPSRDARSGMLPPKVAKMMINMAVGVRPGLNLLDPFCGSGTILQEALLAGHNVIGADISDKAVAASRKNLEWLSSQYKNLPSWRVAKADARLVDKLFCHSESRPDGHRVGGGISAYGKNEIPQPMSIGFGMTDVLEPVDAIISEFHLGPPLSGRESRAQIAAIERELSVLYHQALPPLSRALKDDGRAVFAWPYFKKLDVFVSAFDELSHLGWEVIEPYPQEYQKTFPLSRRGTLLYGRPDQRLWREILVLTTGKNPLLFKEGVGGGLKGR